MREKYIVSLISAGIGNRIRNILSVLRLSKQLSRIPIIYWKKNSLTQCEFSDLFKNKVNVINNTAKLEIVLKKRKWKQYRDVSDKLMRTECDYILICTWRLLTFPNEVPKRFARALPSTRGNDIDFEFHRIPKTIQEEYSGLINTLIPVDCITEQIEKFSRQFDQNTVSIRRESWQESIQMYQNSGRTILSALSLDAVFHLNQNF